MQKSINSITNICDGEETVDEMKKRDTNLSHKSRKVSRPTSIPSDDNTQSKKDSSENIQIKRSSTVKSPVSYRHGSWKSDDDLVAAQHFKPTKQNNEQSMTKKEAVNQQKNRDFQRHPYQMDRARIKLPKSNTIDTQYQSEFLHPERSQHNSSLSSSRQSDDSPSKRYLDLSGDQQHIIENRNIVTLRNENIPRLSAGNPANKYLSNLNSRSSSSQNCRLPGSTNFPFDTSELNSIQQTNNQINKFQNIRPEDIDFCNEIIIRRIQICKYVAIFFIVITAIGCLLFGILHFYVGYYPEMFYLNEGDVKLISASSSFCSGVIAVSRTSNLRVIVFKKNSKNKSTENTITENLSIVPSAVWRRDFYLLHGSSVSMKIKSSYTLDVLIFVGRKRFLIWSQRKQSDTYLKKVSCCASTREKQKTIRFTSSQDERYYIVIHNHLEVIPVAMDIEMTFVRNSYDFSETTHHCLTSKGKSCSAEYTFNNGERAAVEVPLSKDASKIPHSSEVEWKCIARVWFYIVLFIVAFIVISAVVFTVYFITATVCIPSKRCCCAIYDDEKNNSSEFLYHNKYIKDDAGSSDRIVDRSICGKSLKSIRTPEMLLSSSASNKAGLCKVQLPPSTSSRPTNSKYSHHAIPHSKHNYNMDSGVATIYERDRFISDAQGNGISIDSDFRPSRQSYKEDIIHLQELQIQQLKTLRNNQRPRKLVISDGPRVNQLLRQQKPNIFANENYYYEPNYDVKQNYRCKSASTMPNYHSALNVRTASRDNYGYEPASTVPAPVRVKYPYNQFNKLRNMNGPLNQNRDFIQNDLARIPSNRYAVNEFEMNELSSERPIPKSSDEELYLYRVSNRGRRRPESFDQEMFI